MLLWLPTICKHVITEESPLASWLKTSGIMADADASIVVVVRSLLTWKPTSRACCQLVSRLRFAVPACSFN